MPRGTELRRQAAPRPLLPPALRGPAAVLVTGCAAVTASLALAFAGQARPDGLDAAVDAHVRSALGRYGAQTHLLAGLGGLSPVTVLTTALVLACLVTRRWRGRPALGRHCHDRRPALSAAVSCAAVQRGARAAGRAAPG